MKTTQPREQVGYDAGKKIKGRKRQIIVDTMGLLLCVVVHSAGISDNRGGCFAVLKLSGFCRTLQRIWADSGYKKGMINWVLQWAGWSVEIVKRTDDTKGFKVQPKRWVVERTLGWLNWYRRLSKDYEHYVRSSECHIQLAAIRRMVRMLV